MLLELIRRNKVDWVQVDNYEEDDNNMQEIF